MRAVPGADFRGLEHNVGLVFVAPAVVFALHLFALELQFSLLFLDVRVDLGHLDLNQLLVDVRLWRLRRCHRLLARIFEESLRVFEASHFQDLHQRLVVVLNADQWILWAQLL